MPEPSWINFNQIKMLYDYLIDRVAKDVAGNPGYTNIIFPELRAVKINGRWYLHLEKHVIERFPPRIQEQLKKISIEDSPWDNLYLIDDRPPISKMEDVFKISDA